MRKRKVMTDRELELAFLFFNIHFFDAKLQKPNVIKFGRFTKHEDIERDGVLQENEKGAQIIIAEDLKYFGNMAILALIHEMAHLKLRTSMTLPGGHGMIFDAEIVRLFNAGAYEGLL